MSVSFSKLDPRVALVNALLLTSLVASLQNLAACFLAFSAAAIFTALVPGYRICERIMTVNAFILLIWLTVPWLTPGEPMWQWHGFVISRPGFNFALSATLKANAILFIFLALIAPMPRYDLANALLYLRVPDKLVLLLLLVDRNIEILKDQWRSLTEAAKLRCFEAKMSLRAYKVIAAKLALLLLRASDRADRLHEALLLRAFSGRLRCSATYRAGRKDLLFSIGAVFFCILLLGCEYGLPTG